MFKKSIMVLSHPDDEVLWFSSILEKVDEVVICYLGCRSKPDWAEGRRQSIAEHPIKHITCLGMDESEVFKGADWQNPVVTKYGIEIINKNLSYSRYRENYHILKKHLTGILPNFENVFTHNPWGEYGNEEHVQLYRVIRELRDNMNFNLWFSSYCSNQSSSLLFRYISGFDNCYATFRTNKDLAEEAMKLYKRHNCWTWYDDWEWFNEESFMKDKVSPAEMKRYGHIFPLNLIKFNYPGVPKEETRQSRVRTAPLRSYLGRILRKSGLRRKRIPES
ncbi:MAG: hypothetical protein P8Z71_11385, partial [Candidatus Sulfobium sp.]